jgi:hypothetical protein
LGGLSGFARSSVAAGQGKNVDRLVVWDFEFRSLRFICDLVFGAWIFNSLSSNCLKINYQSINAR